MSFIPAIARKLLTIGIYVTPHSQFAVGPSAKAADHTYCSDDYLPDRWATVDSAVKLDRAEGICNLRRVVGRPQTANLFKACESGDIGLAQEILAKFPEQLEAPLGSGGWTPLIVAAFNQHLELVRWLVENQGASVHATNAKGTTVLMYAKTRYRERGSFDLLEYLLKRGADIHARDAKGLTVLDYVRGQGDSDLLGFLMQNGVSS